VTAPPAGAAGGPGGGRELTPHRVRILAVSLVVLAGLTIWRVGFGPDAPPSALAEFRGEAWGTTWSVKLDHEVDDVARADVQSAIEGELERVDALMSTWRDDSELAALNAHPVGDPMAVSDGTLEVLRIARDVSEATGGAFDVTVGPLVAVWGFGADAGPPEPPASEVLEAARARVDWRGLELDAEAGTATRTVEGLRVDLSAVAKGWGVDAIAEAVTELGYPRHLIEVGGELRAGAIKEDGSPWRVAIETPDARTRRIHGVIEVTGEGIATSGDYRNFYTVDGVRYAHIIDPRTGRPVTHSGTSVTVVDGSTAVADAWATALGVLGPEEGWRVAEARGLTALFIWQEGDDYRSRATPSMQARTPDDPARTS